MARTVIAGAGIGGLVAALSLHHRGINDIVVLEAAQHIEPLGVGLNILPNAVQVLRDLNVLDQLLPQAVQTSELRYYNCHGDLIWAEPRGTAAGYVVPQLSIHRGDLHGVLLATVRERLGYKAVVIGAAITDVVEDEAGAHARVGHADGTFTAFYGDLVIGADGIDSAVRTALWPDQGAPARNGVVMWRGTSWTEPFLDGRTMIVSGDDVRRIVLYPIRTDEKSGRVMVNWVAAQPSLGGTSPRTGGPSDVGRLSSSFAVWNFDWLDISAIIAKSEQVHEYPMQDRDPLPRWTSGRVTLLGDAAHAMYPMGSNGATQAVMDAWVLATALAEHDSLDGALLAYETERRPITTELQIKNRSMGPEAVITVAHERAPHGFANVNDVFTQGELAAISQKYALAGNFDVDSVNRRTGPEISPEARRTR
ncbi:2-polyprenyl-6-methoxyphenol hydroxylase [Lentzea waywayandensis]|uniref:2-polyprenyl-6-methoxyphenol hydroxylase n=1 Tax=Lentzea waywayandensis TaxID=84724 RepID=A0A1I6FFH6_9PSEU|nr:flavin-dependent oxidoreductase [Lentzea waywayandensis]SFR28699.1 2-polyprenyl-6-methoxyphenol hydroxylase [Lentzea waywayandensis]